MAYRFAGNSRLVSRPYCLLPIPAHGIEPYLTCCSCFTFPVFLYLAAYLFPMYVFSFFAAIALGISLHSFVPLLVCIFIIRLLVRMCKYRKSYAYSFFSGLFIAALITLIFCISWSAAVDNMNKAYRNAIRSDNNEMPIWIQVAQPLPANSLNEKILKAGIVYVAPDYKAFNFFWNVPSRNFNEPIKHDPLISLASLFASVDLNEEERIKILEAKYDSRHETEERLWSGDDLSTSDIYTNISVWPHLQLAYMEKTITVQNTAIKGWPQAQEALYTFYLPEDQLSVHFHYGSTAPNKSVLTTRQKATEAYKTIVGVESRDPSVVHWQEGNRVVARIFPVMNGGNRIFKIGITMPLQKNKDQVTLQNTWFKGPVINNAKESIKINFQQAPENVYLPGFFEKEDALHYTYEGAYQNEWQLQFDNSKIVEQPFRFAGKKYISRDYIPHTTPFAFENYYLDINQAWTKAEFEQLYDKIKNKNVYVYDGEMTKLTTENAVNIFKKLSSLQFSLFPFYKIQNPLTALVITKGNEFSPNLNEVNESNFGQKLKTFFRNDKRSYVINVGDEQSPYINTLKEHRAIYFEQATLDQCLGYIEKQQFPFSIENENEVIIKDAKMVITATDDETTDTKGPDHLLRLFAYNNIMKRLDHQIVDSTLEKNELIKDAELANIVTPVSSLIVLETQADYDRFNIKESNESLKNASNKKSGAVPEPHEWVLIIIAAVVMAYLIFSSRLNEMFCKS